MFLRHFAVAACVVLLASAAHAQTDAQSDCINGIHKDFSKLVATQGKEVLGCLKSYSKLKIGEEEVEACLTSDPKDKVAKAAAALAETAADDCQGLDGDGITKTPPFGPLGDASPNAIGIDNTTDLFRDLLGALVAETVAPAVGETKNISKCQLGIAKTLTKCQDTRLKEYVSCVASGLRGRTPPGAITDDVSLSIACLMANGIPTSRQPDDRGKIAKSCGSALSRAIDKKCGPVLLDDVFPGLVEQGGAELDRAGACRMCLAAGSVDNLSRDCDLFDNGVADLSCAACVDAESTISALVPSEVCVSETQIVDTGLIVDLCLAELGPPACTSGAGCHVAIVAGEPTIDYDAGTAAFTASIDGSGFVARADIQDLGVFDCTADVLTADVQVDLEFVTLATRSGAVIVDSVTSAISDVSNVVLEISGGGGFCAFAASSFLPTVETELETAVDQLLAAEVIPLITGEGLCLY